MIHFVQMRAMAIMWLCVVGWGSAAFGAIDPIVLPEEHADFALNPATGDVAAITTEKNQIVLYRAKDLQRGIAKPAKRTDTGKMPVSVTYKRFGDKAWFATVCADDSTMVLVDADDLKHVKTIELDVKNVFNISNSTNPDDPYIYYCDKYSMGAVNVRDMKNKGRLRGNGNTAAAVISADGKFAYPRRSRQYRTDLKSAVRTTSFDAEKPTFAWWGVGSVRRTMPPYVPGPHGKLMATQSAIYSADLRKNITKLEIEVAGFSAKRPLIFGLQSKTPDAATPILRAASYNTFKVVGDPIRLNAKPKPKPKPVSVLAPPKTHKNKPKRDTDLPRETRLMPDDARDRLVFARADTLYLVSYQLFAPPDEPVLAVDLKGSRELPAGKAARLEMTLVDDRAKLQITKKPDGMTVSGRTLTWTPTLDQIGPAKVEVALSAGELNQTETFHLEVVYPGVDLPFSPASFAITPDGKRVVIWQRAFNSGYSRKLDPPAPYRVAVVDLATGRVAAETELDFSPDSGVVSDEHVMFRQSRTTLIDVRSLKTLQRTHRLVIDNDVNRTLVHGEHLIVMHGNNADVYKLPDLDRVRRYEFDEHRRHFDRTPPVAALSEGLLIDGIVYDEKMHPRKIIAISDIPHMPGAVHRHVAFRDDRRGPSYSPTADFRQIQLMDLPGASRKLMLEFAKTHAPSGYSDLSLYRVAVRDAAIPDIRQVLVGSVRKNNRSRDMKYAPSTPKMTLQDGQAFVVYSDRLYRWTVPPFSEKVVKIDPRWTGLPDQVVLRRTGRSTLKHPVIGGKTPLNYSLLTKHPGLTLDAETGQLTIDHAKLTAAAENAAGQQLTRRARPDQYLQMTTTRIHGARTIAQTIFRDWPDQVVPVAVPIRISVSDASLNDITIEYMLIAMASKQPLLDHAAAQQKKYAQEMARRQLEAAKHAAEMQAARQAQAENDFDENEAEQLRRRIKMLEARVEQLTRQVSTLTRQLEQKQ